MTIYNPIKIDEITAECSDFDYNGREITLRDGLFDGDTIMNALLDNPGVMEEFIPELIEKLTEYFDCEMVTLNNTEYAKRFRWFRIKQEKTQNQGV